MRGAAGRELRGGGQGRGRKAARWAARAQGRLQQPKGRGPDPGAARRGPLGHCDDPERRKPTTKRVRDVLGEWICLLTPKDGLAREMAELLYIWRAGGLRPVRVRLGLVRAHVLLGLRQDRQGVGDLPDRGVGHGRDMPSRGGHALRVHRRDPGDPVARRPPRAPAQVRRGAHRVPRAQRAACRRQ